MKQNHIQTYVYQSIWIQEMCIGYKHVSLDDLDEKLFAAELSATELEAQEQPAASSSTKWFPWNWKHSLPISSEEDAGVKKVGSSTSLENSRRGSACSVQSSPVKSSPKRNKEHSKRNKSANSEDQNDSKGNLRMRKERKESSDLIAYEENKANFGSRLYSVLEEQVLGEMINESLENLYSEGNKSIGFRTTAALSTNTWYWWFSFSTLGSLNFL